MSRVCLLAVLLASVLLPPARGGEPAGIQWEAELEAGLKRAGLEGRPVLFAINAIEQEAANDGLARRSYPSAAWGGATREYVCFVCNDNVHGTGTTCMRYGDIPCAVHKGALRYVMRRFGRDLISPQHIVIDGDGRLVYRKQYYTGEVGPELLDAIWPRVAPELAYERAGELRISEIDAFDALERGELEVKARAWLASRDPLAAASLLRALDFASDDARRLKVLSAFAAAEARHLPSLDLLADEYGTRPDDRPDETKRFASSLLEADRGAGFALLMRIAVRTGDAPLRRWALSLVKPASDEEKAALAEARLLCGLEAKDRGSGREGPVWGWRLRRAAKKKGELAGVAYDLDHALAEGRPAMIWHALLEADPVEVEANLAAVGAFEREGSFRLRAAAGLALLGARMGAEGRLPGLLWRAVNDPVEGPEVRARAVELLGEDPGWNEDVWREAVEAHLQGGK